MSLLKEIKNNAALTEREQDIRNYILEHPEQISTMSSRELGEATFTSAATVTRFCQKLGCKGYPDFRIRFLSEVQAGSVLEEEKKVQLSERENVVSLVQKVSEMQKQALEETRKELSLEQLMRVGEMLHQAEYIDFYAYDVNIHLARYGCSQFFHAGKIANAYTESNVQELQALIKKEKHLAIIISHTGENAKLVEIARTLKRNHTKIIVIATGKQQTLASWGDEFLYAASSQGMNEFWSAVFFTSAKYLLDLLFGIEFSHHYEENMKLNQTYERIGKDKLWSFVRELEGIGSNIDNKD